VSTYTKNRLDSVRRCIDSLKNQSLACKEIVLVLDPDEDLVDFYRRRLEDDVKLVLSDKRGLSNARNTGIKNAKGEIVAFIDDDAVADENWLSKMVSNYDDPKVVGVGGTVMPRWEGSRSVWFPEELDWIVGCSYKGLPECRTVVRNPIGCNMSFRKNVFKKVGFFSTKIGRFGRKLLAGEEPEFSIRVLKTFREAKIIYDPSAVVYHDVPKGRANLRYALERSFYEGLSKAIITSKRNSVGDLSREDAYIKYILGVTMPSKLKRFYKLENLCHLAAVTASMLMVLMGFSIGKLQKK